MKRIFPFLMLLFITSALHAGDPQSRKIDSLMQVSMQRGVFNGNILVARHGKIIYQASLGFADGSRTKKLNPDLSFDIGSICKEFNGTGIMILKERGLLSLDDPISKFFPALPAWAAKVKVRHLLNYTSGIPLFSPTAADSDQEMLKNLMELKELSFESGTAYIYNHYNVYLQMRMIEKISGQSYADFVTKNILIPCKMSHSKLNYPTNGPGMAIAFNNDFQTTRYAQEMTGWLRLPVRDLYQYITKLESYSLISKESFRELAENFPGGESSLGSTGFENGELTWHQHQGSNSNYEALVYSDLKSGVRIVMMTNNQNFKVHALKSAILSILKDEPFTIPKRSVYLDIRDKILADHEKGLQFFSALKADHQDQYDFSFETGDLISTGKYLQRRNKLEEAISLFHLAILPEAKPADLSYGYELIGESYLKLDKKQEAAIYFKKAIATDPGNKNAAGLLNTLSGAR
ncbi:CubicO group peptidase, beta-lactamase class C family [Pedobacter westerhofensis]|uniref:CubicO group peptidase, beta-lactamase class C family n=1 Tax=Pedobacter westerhofensis TaxID=425512 RepID=A0A521CWU3_9SPHI|nr:serine hydrolase domain-containing protein [Pedobacter westerhofensis]SMO63888.1 CubicO group peptidase, beta-lactamase class C family [Pedobacter westerhofensis]